MKKQNKRDNLLGFGEHTNYLTRKNFSPYKYIVSHVRLKFNKKLNGGLFIMEIKEKIKKIYQKSNIIVNDDYIENAMKNKERVKGYMRLYEEEEIESMNYIFGKNRENKQFTKFELELASQIDLFNRKVISICREMYKNRNNSEKLEEIIKKFELEVNV